MDDTLFWKFVRANNIVKSKNDILVMAFEAF